MALDHVDTQLSAGRVTALIGPSGSGKSTLLRLLLGLEWPDSGTVLFDGAPLRRDNLLDHRRRIGYVIQEGGLFPHLTAIGNIGLLAETLGWPRSRVADRAGELARLCQLPADALQRYPAELSGGQRQRVGLIRALMLDPAVLLLDEPLGALDAKLRTATQFELMDIQEKTGTTFVIVTHDQEEAMTVASRVAVMDTGRVIQADTPARIYETPNSVYVADFIGEVTILSGTARKSGAGYEIHYAEGVPPLYAEDEARFDNGETCHIALRPEKVAISAERPEDRRNAVEGTIIDIAYLGNLSTYHVKLATGQMIKAQTANTRRLALRGFTWEDKVWLSWTDTAAVLLKE